MTKASNIPKALSKAPARRYDKGERRYKHVGRNPFPEIVFENNNPRKAVGKCPNNLQATDHVRLVNEAIAGDNGDADVPYAKCLYTVHEGVIYEAQTSDRGKHYHGYPYHGLLEGDIITKLRLMAIKKECLQAFERWVKDHIEEHG